VDADQSSEVRHAFLVVADQTASARVADRVDADRSSEVRHVFLVAADQTVSVRVADRVDAGQIPVAQASVTVLENPLEALDAVQASVTVLKSAAADLEAVHEAGQAAMCVVEEAR
jgi:hypothetical protein